LKSGKLIFILFLLLSTGASASHILGGEITYLHIKDLKYKIQTVIYRDCNGCKLMGAGGGESTQDCGSFDLFIATSDKSSCGRKNIVKINLERKKITELLPVCISYRTKCQSNANLPFGVEAHYFESEVDFNDYSTYKGCAFEIFTNISWRTKGISTIDDDQPFYNYAYINPWVAHHSPEIGSEISPIIYCKQPYYFSHGVKDINGDSLSYHMVSAKSDYNKDVAYKSGYSPSNPLDVYCSGCTPNENVFPPEAFNFNTYTGDVAFTPVSCGQTAVMVLEIRKWVKISGVMEMISAVRRDLQYIVLSSTDNNPPQPLQKSSVIEICAGEELSFDISFEDKPYKYPDDTYGPKDSLQIFWDEAIPGAKLSRHTFSENGQFKATLNWKTALSDVRDFPYQFRVYANDGACPLNSISSRTFEIRVIKPAEVNLEVDSLECGYREIKAQSDDFLKLKDWSIYDKNDPSNPTEFLTESALFKASKIGKYFVQYQAKDAAQCNILKIDSFEITTSDFKGFDLHILGSQTVCENSKIELSAMINGQHQIKKNFWTLNGDVISNKDSLLIPKAYRNMAGTWILQTEGVLNGRSCTDSIEFDLIVKTPPQLDGSTYEEVCSFDGNLQSLFGVSQIGEWTSDFEGVRIAGVMADLSQVNRAIDQAIPFKLAVTDTTNGCAASDIYTLQLKSLPELEVEDIAYCKSSGNFYIDNMVIRPLSRHLLNLTWVLDEEKLKPQLDLINQRWYVPFATVENGTYKIIFTQLGLNGCRSIDSAELTVLDELKISLNRRDSICGGTTQDLNQLMNVFPSGGGWYSANNTQYVNNNQLLPEACGPLLLSYTYDQFGCYDKINILLYAECLEPIQFNNAFSQICSNYGPVNLNASPAGGLWTGTGISANIFNPTGLSGDYVLNYQVEGMICKNTKAFNMEVSSPPFLDVSRIAPMICEGEKWDLNPVSIMADSIRITASGLLTMAADERSWIEYKPSESEIASGKADIFVKLSNAGLCAPLEQVISAKISQKPLVVFPSEMKGCAPAKLRILPDYIGKNDPATGWNWTIQDEGQTNSSSAQFPLYTYTIPGNFDLNLQLTTADQCTYDYDFPKQVWIDPSPMANFESDPGNFASQLNPTFRFINRSAGGTGATYLWNFGTGRSNQFSTQENPTFTFPNDTGKYLVSCTVTNIYGCKDEASQWIEIGPDIRVYIPNAFTPDGKGPEQNSKYRITASDFSSFHMIIINRLGGVVFQSDDISEGWDGTSFGKPSMPGVYVYDIQLVSRTGKKYKYNGTLNLIR
jgi:gliding motility-associated-like protein